jgi:hypothetical protein
MRWWQALVAWFQKILSSAGSATSTGGPRVSGEPTSSNGASSMHLWWQLPYGQGLTAVRATLEVIEPPAVDRLYFWALQAAFVKPDGGAAHFGLQFHPSHPGSTAVNFGGYAPRAVGGQLEGTVSVLPSSTNNLNTRDFAWEPHRRYRLAVERVDVPAPGGFYAWQGAVEDLETGELSVVRVLFSRGEFLRGPVVWTESFARCEQPSVAVRWSDLEAVGETKGTMAVTTGSVNYQRREAGGCDNTNTTVEGGGWVQRTSTERTVRSGTRLTVH